MGERKFGSLSFPIPHPLISYFAPGLRSQVKRIVMRQRARITSAQKKEMKSL
jgi:hypothetical protein